MFNCSFTFFLLLFTFLFFPCNSTVNASTTVAAVESAKSFGSSKNTPFYKHLRGFINGDIPITMDFMKSNFNTCNGFYYYDKMQEPIPLNGVLDSSLNFAVTANEVTDTTKWEQFSGKWIGEKLEGTWRNFDGSKLFPFTLRSDYSDGAMPFSISNYVVSVKVIDSLKHEYMATYSAQFLLFNSTTNNLPRFILDSMVLDGLGSKNEVLAATKRDADTFLHVYPAEIKEEVRLRGDTAYMYALNYEMSNSSEVYYNSGKLLTLKHDVYQYTGGAHGMYYSTLRVYDLKRNKVLKIKDIFKPGYEAGVTKIMTKHVKDLCGIKPDEDIHNNPKWFFFADTIPPNENFFITPKGIGFLYNNYELAAYCFGQQTYYLPFDQLKEYIREDFKP